MRAALTDDVVGVSVSAVDFRTGFRADLAALREAIGPDRLLVIVDAIQAFGVARMAWDAADVVVAGGQKWLRAGWATGFAALSDRALESLEPVLTGWTGVEDVGVFDGTEHAPAVDARRWSITNLSPVTAAAFAAALGLVERYTVAAIEAAIALRVAELTEVVEEHGGRVLSPADPARRAGVLSFAVPGHDPSVVAKALHGEGVTPTVRADSLRFSPHASTPPEACARVAAALASLGVDPAGVGELGRTARELLEGVPVGALARRADGVSLREGKRRDGGHRSRSACNRPGMGRSRRVPPCTGRARCPALTGPRARPSPVRAPRHRRPGPPRRRGRRGRST